MKQSFQKISHSLVTDQQQTACSVVWSSLVDTVRLWYIYRLFDLVNELQIYHHKAGMQLYKEILLLKAENLDKIDPQITKQIHWIEKQYLFPDCRRSCLW